MQVEDIMTEDLGTVAPNASLRDAIDIMLDRHIGSVLIVDAGLLGILTRTDVLRAIQEDNQPVIDVAVRTVMREEVVTIRPAETVAAALRKMADNNVKKLPVRDGLDIVGILTLTDIARHQPDRVDEVRRAIQRKGSWTN